MLSDVVRILIPAAATFAIGMAMTPIVAHYLYAFKAWKKTAGKTTLYGSAAEEFGRLHNANEVRAPRMGGIIVWGSVVFTIGIIWVLAQAFPTALMQDLDYLSRSQTWVPLAALLVGAFFGLLDDLLAIQPGSGGGMQLRYRLAVVLALSLLIGYWFYDRLDVTSVSIPFGAPIEIGMLIIPFFVFVSLAIYASGVIDGIDGLSGGVFASIFASYTIIAFAQHQLDLAALSASVVGGLLAFLWFNIPPARFYMTDTGTMALTLCLPVIAFMTDTLGDGVGVAVLPLIGALLVATVASDVLQMIWRTFFKRKLFRIAPLHHHFEAIGWPGTKVTMRYWVLSVVFAVLGVILALVG